MGRKERRQAERESGIKKKSVHPFIAPVAPISIESLMAKHPELVESVHQWEVKVRKEAADRSLNLTMAGMVIELYKKYGFGAEELKKTMAGAMNAIQLAWQNIVTFEELITVCENIGMDSMDLDYEKVNKSAEEVMEYIRQWEGLREDMSKRDEVFKCMDNGIKETAKIVKITGIKKNTVDSYKTLWEKAEAKKKQPKSMDEFIDSMFDDDEQVQNVSEVVGNEPQGEEKDNSSTNDHEQEKNENRVNIEPNKESVELKENDKKEEVIKKKRKITVTTNIEGDFGTHTVTNQLAEINFDTANMCLTKDQVEELIEDLQIVKAHM